MSLEATSFIGVHLFGKNTFSFAFNIALSCLGYRPCINPILMTRKFTVDIKLYCMRYVANDLQEKEYKIKNSQE